MNTRQSSPDPIQSTMAPLSRSLPKSSSSQRGIPNVRCSFAHRGSRNARCPSPHRGSPNVKNSSPQRGEVGRGDQWHPTPVPPALLAAARTLRKNMTDAEHLL